MIYCALECFRYSVPNEPSLSLWFEAASPNDAYERARQILALLWDTSIEDVEVNSMPTSVLDRENNSAEDRLAGDRRWLESGSHGRYPTYYAMPGGEVVFLPLHQRKKLDAARRDAVDNAREVARQMRAEDPATFELTIESLERFVAVYGDSSISNC